MSEERDIEDLAYERYTRVSLHNGEQGRLNGWLEAASYVSNLAGTAFERNEDERAKFLRTLASTLEAAAHEKLDGVVKDALDAAADAETAHIEAIEQREE